jgi:hypothetical protein
MAVPSKFRNLVQGTVDHSALVWKDGARVIHGVGNPTQFQTGKGRAGPGSLYIRTDQAALWENVGTKIRPTWQHLYGGAD